MAMFQPTNFLLLEQMVDPMTKTKQVWKVKLQVVKPDGT